MNDPQGTIARAKADAQRLADLARETTAEVEELIRKKMREALERGALNGDLRAVSMVLRPLSACAKELEVMGLEAKAGAQL